MKTNYRFFGLIALALVVFISSCQLPWLAFEGDEAESGPVSLVIGAAARSIRPDPVAPTTLEYRLTLTPAVGIPLVVDNYSLGTSFTDPGLVPGEWTILVEGFYGGNFSYPAFSGLTTLSLAAGPNTVNLDLAPQQLNDGQISFTLSWPPLLVDDVSIDWLLTLGGASTLLDPALYTLDLVNGELTVSGAWPSGTFYFGVSLFKNTYKVAGVYEVLRVYDALPSVGAVVLDASRISKPPVQPGSLAVNHPGSFIDLTWADLANTEEGYRIYRKKDGDLDFTPMGADLAPGTSTVTDIDTSSYPGGMNIQYRVAAFNDFGESAYAEISYRMPPAFSGGFSPPMEEGFDSYYGVQLSWAPVIGADTLELWMEIGRAHV